MKNHASKKNKIKTVTPEEGMRPVDGPVTGDAGLTSINDFIKIKKLQNQILEKLIENITNQESSKKIKNRKNK